MFNQRDHLFFLTCNFIGFYVNLTIYIGLIYSIASSSDEFIIAQTASLRAGLRRSGGLMERTTAHYCR